MKRLFRVFCCLSFVAICFGMVTGVMDWSLVSDVLFGTGNVSLGFAAAMGVAGGVKGPGGSIEGTVTHTGVDEFDDIHELDLDKTIVKVRPSDVPMDTLIRELGASRNTESIITGGYEIGTRDVEDALTVRCDGSSDVMAIGIGKKGMWLPDDTLIVPSVKGGDGKPLQLYVVSKDNQAGTLQVIAANPTSENKIPAIEAGVGVIRLGTAKGETDAQATAYSLMPVTRYNNCQIHMCQVEESVIESLSKKKVNMDFSTYKEQSIWEMRRSMEFTNLFGVRSVMSHPNDNKPVYTSDGLWNIVDSTFEFDSTKAFDNKFYVAMTKDIFSDNNGSDRRILFAGDDFLERMAYVEAFQKQMDAKSVEVVHGIRFNKIVTNFGELLIKPHKLFVGGFRDCGMVLDMSYIRKETYEALHTTELDLDKSGQKRVKAHRMLENYCLFVENLPAHRKIRPQV